MAGINAYDKLTYGEFKLPSLQELMVAPMYMQEQHNKAQEEFLASQALSADAATRFQPGIDDAAIAANDEFQASVNADIESLSKNGLTPNVKRNLLQRKADFTNKILPLNKAAIDREAWAKAAREAQLKNPSLIIKDPMSVSLDRWISDPTSRELHPINGLEIAERTRAQMLPISKYISQNIPTLAKTGLPYQYFTAVRSGATESDIAQALAYNEGVDINKASTLAKMIVSAAQNVVRSTGVYDYYGVGSPEAERAWEYAESEFNNALGSTKWGNIADEYSMRYNLEGLKASAKKNTKIAGLYFPDRLGSEIDVPSINTLKNIKEKFLSKGSNNVENWASADGWGSYRVPNSHQGTMLANSELKKLGIDPSQYNNKEELIAAIDTEIDKLGKKYGYTIFDSKDLKEGFVTNILPSLESGSLKAYSSIEDALNNKNPLSRSTWFSPDIKDLQSILSDKDSNSFSIESLDNQGLIRVRAKEGKKIYYIKPEDIDQSEIGYYNALRKIRAMSDDEFNTEYMNAYNKLREALEYNDSQNAYNLNNYLEFLSELRTTTTPSRNKTAMISSGQNKEIQYKPGD